MPVTLEAVDLLAACHRSGLPGPGETIEIVQLASQPLLVLDSSFVFRRTFDAACRLAGFEPTIRFETRTPQTLLAMAERRHGIAIIPSALPLHRHALRIKRLTYRGKPLREPLAIFRDRRRPLPAYAEVFCEMLADYMRKVLPVTRPSPATKPRPSPRRRAAQKPRSGPPRRSSRP